MTPLSRRTFLALGAGGVAAVAVGTGTGARWPAGAQAPPSGPFLHGVASGDPLADRVILWTRVTTAAGSGPVEVTWEIARDPDFTAVVARGTMTTDESVDFTVHVDPAGLEPGVDHWYRFHALGGTSPVGRTRTAPAPGAAFDCLRLGVVTCAEYEFGYFSAYRHLAARDDIDAVLHLGDYIYEFGIGYGPLPSPGPRQHDPPHEITTLAHYRTRYAQYRRDPDLQALHAAHPMIATWDDHEIANDAYRTGAENHTEGGEGVYADRLAAAAQAWHEWLPVRAPDPSDSKRIYRTFRFGDLVELWMLDERQYRDKHPGNALFGYGSIDPSINDDARTLLGPAQEKWLGDGLVGSSAAWKVLGNPVPFVPMNVAIAPPEPLHTLLTSLVGALLPLPVPLSVEDWNGYAKNRQRITDLGVPDLVILTGDYHESFASDIPKRQGDYVLDGNSAAVEFIAPAVTSPGLSDTLGTPLIDTAFEANLATNPWIRYHDGFANGFGVVEFTAERVQYDFWFIGDKFDPQTTARVDASWQSVRGANKLSRVGGPLAARTRTGGAVVPVPVAPAAPPDATVAAVSDVRPVLARTGDESDRWLGAAALVACAALAARAVVATPKDEGTGGEGGDYPRRHRDTTGGR